jgi:hypothetical protein
MTALLDELIAAHGGLPRWNKLDRVSAHLVQGGALWAIKGQGGVLDEVYARVSLHEARESHHPFGADDRRSSFTPVQVAVESTRGEIIERAENPRSSFDGHTLQTPWTRLQLAYFVGYAMWNYLTQPFTFALDGFETSQLDTWQAQNEEWRRLRVVWPEYLATHTAEQTIYVGNDGLIRRHDYEVDILGGAGGAHFLSDYTEVAGIKVPTKHRIFPRESPGGTPLTPLLISIDVSEITFT